MIFGLDLGVKKIIFLKGLKIFNYYKASISSQNRRENVARCGGSMGKTGGLWEWLGRMRVKNTRSVLIFGE